MRPILRVLTPNPGLKLVCLTAALGAWILFRVQPEYETAVEGRLSYTNVPPGVEVNPDTVGPVTLVLRGPRHLLDSAGTAPLPVRLDFSQVYGPGEYSFGRREFEPELPEGVRLVRTVPSQVRISLEPVARREVPVHPRFLGNNPRGYRVASYHVEPERLVVVGPESRVALIDGVPTDPIDLSDVVGRRSVLVRAYLPDPYVRFEGDARVAVELRMKKY